MKLVINIILFAACTLLFACTGTQSVSNVQSENNSKTDNQEVKYDANGKQILPAARMPVGKEVAPEKARMQVEEVQ
jgi:outer membrane biogenesis lipoprotein LolB